MSTVLIVGNASAETKESNVTLPLFGMQFCSMSKISIATSATMSQMVNFIMN
jgi:hypothetical protein